MQRLLALIAVAWACNAGYGDTLTLLHETGEWHDPQAWDAGRAPLAGDEAVIPAGATCTVEPLGLVVCRAVHVEATGLLVLDRETLVLGSDDPGVDVVCRLDGRISFKDDYANTPPARIVPDGGWVAFEGVGELYASRASGEEYQGRLRCCAVTGYGPCDSHSGKGFWVKEGVTVRGSLHLHACLRLDGDWVVDYEEDVSQVGVPVGTLCGGVCTVPLTLAGTGQFVVIAGRLEIGRLDVAKQAPRVVQYGGTVMTETTLRSRFK